MNRKKIKIAYFNNDVARNVAYKKRKNVMVKKLSEITTLCGVENRKMKLTQIMYQNLGREGPLNVKNEDMVDLGELSDEKLKDIDMRIEALDKQDD
ncbi:hypothetical protein V6N13_139690 [Hibiscus sabdariffa]|uniref:MADS-box domain-containing protein n=1 Tax=Hibiscus sabdariffa TaxID=183260 RepID=A0ABR2C9A3_9ROSI